MIDFKRQSKTDADGVRTEPRSEPKPARAAKPGRTEKDPKAPRTMRRGLSSDKRTGTVLKSWRAKAASLGRRLWAASEPYRATAAPWLAKIRRALAVVSTLGWVTLVAGLVAIMAGARLGWRELSYVGAVFVLLFVIAILFAIGRALLAVTLELSPPRVVQGEPAAAQVVVRNAGKAPLLPMGLEFAVGERAARFTLPTLAPDATFDDMIVIPTSRRGVIPVGPVITQRGDPFGIMRREIAWTKREELFVHPLTVPLEALGAGLLRDLEGRTTQDISMSDLAFHTLRDYAPGDDRRYIHWRSSAKVAGVHGEERFLVRQFLDTRRSHIGVVTDVARESYRSDAEFELALSVGASIAVRAMADEMDLTLVCGPHVAVQPNPHLALDTYSRAELDGWSLARAGGQLRRLAPDVSVVLLVTGPECPYAEFQRAKSYLPREVAVAAIRVEEGGSIGLRETAGITVVSLGALSELPRVMAGGQVA